MSLLVSTTSIALVICSYYLCLFLVNFCLRIASSRQRDSAPLPSPEPSAPQWKYDVFLSFRGEETRKGIAFEIYDGLKNRGGIKTFMDEQELQAGAPISPSLLKAIEESRFAIIVLSPNYASSSWCLEELTKIVDCMKDHNRILPLFYHVEPSDVRHQKNSFEVAFTKHEATKRHDREMVKHWRYALETVANFSGWDTQNYKTERELVEVIVESVCNKVGCQVTEITKEAEEFLKDEIQGTKSPPKNLQTEVDKLTVAKATVAEKVTAAYAKGEKIHVNVLDWLNKVDDITKEAQEFLKDEIQATEESHDSMNHRSKKSFELLQVVTQLYETIEFSDISYVVQVKDYCLESGQDYQEFNSRASTVEKIMDELRSPNCADIILVHGIGGVGKTTLAEEVLRQAEKQKLFDDLVMVRDVKKPNLEAIQRVIADKLGLNLSEIQTTAGRADKICDRVKGQKTRDESKQDKKTLVILDDVWEEIDLKAVGLPHIKTCRILLTSRTSKLFSADMINQKPFQLGVLGEEETWLLFEQRAGNVVEDHHIRTIATQLAKKCGGLPVLVVTVASSLRNEARLPIWRYALSSLERFDKEEELTEKAYSVLEWSYEQLTKHLKPLFLLCGAIVEGNSISLTNLFKYSMGLGFFKKTKNVKEARDALDTQVGKLKASNLLLDGDDDTCVRMHDLVHHVVNQIASRDHHILVQDGADDELKEWTEEDLFRCSKISLPSCNIATLPEVPWECPKLEMFHLHSKDDDSSRDMPSNFFEMMKKLRVLGLNNLPPISLPPTLKGLEHLQTLCLDGCMCEDIAQVGELTSLQILSIVKSKVKQLPKEIGQLTGLRLLDLSDCSLLEVISPGVIANLTSLEDLRMRNSFDKWEGEGVFCETSNAKLLELKNLSKLTALEIHIPDANILPPELFSNKLERYQIVVGGSHKKRLSPTLFLRKKWNRMYETTLNTLKLNLTTSNELDQGLTLLLEKCDVLSLDGTKGFDLAYIINTKKVMFNLTTLSVRGCRDLKWLLSSSMARNFKKLKHLKISQCKIMEQIISTREHDEEDIIFGELKSLQLESLPKLARFCTGKNIEFPLLEKLYIQDCTQLGAFVGRPMAKSGKGEIRQADLEEQFDVHNDSTFLFDEKVRFPRLEILLFFSRRRNSELQTIWYNQLAPGSFAKIREVYLLKCKNLRSIFPPSMLGRLNALETLEIKGCESVDVVFDVRGDTNANKTHGTSTTQLKDGQNLISVEIFNCDGLKNIFPASMAARCLQQLQKLHVSYCPKMKSIVDKEEGGLELTTAHPKFVFPKVKSLTFSYLSTLGSFYPGLHASEWPLLKNLAINNCDKMEFLAAELSIFRERQYTPTKQPFFLIDQEMMSNLTTLSVNGCDDLKYLLSSSMVRNLKNLEHLKISNCKIMEQIVSTREHDEEDNMFSELKSLELNSLPNLARFCVGKCIEFPSLEKLNVWNCTKLGAFIGGPMTKCRKGETGERDLQENIDINSDSTFIFDKKVRFPRLETLHLVSNYGGSELQTIWHNQLAPSSFGRLREVNFESRNSLKSIFPPSMIGRLNALETLNIRDCESVEVVFDERGEAIVNETHGTSTTQLKDGQNLISVEIFDCDGLKTIFPASMVARCLQQLQELYVSDCPKMETIVAKEEGGLELTTTHPKFVFPKVKSLTFSCLSTLGSFYPGLHTSKWPLLKYLDVQNCDKVEFLAAELSVFQKRQHAPTKQPFFLIDQDSFPVLEEMSVGTTEILYGQSPAESIFSKLKSIRFNGCAPFSKHAAVLFLQKLHNLESLDVNSPCSEEIFVDEGNIYSSGEIHAVGSLPRVRNLKLSSMDNLMHLGKQKHSQPVFPNLEFLGVRSCHRLKNLESSAISFQNLTALEVYGCDGLECLIPYSIAKCLVHLTKMEVSNCESIVAIVASNGDDDAGKNEISFSQLQHLTLESLPSLQGFCSGNCIAKLPLSLIPDVTDCPIKLTMSPDGVPIPERLKITEEAAK